MRKDIHMMKIDAVLGVAPAPATGDDTPAEVTELAAQRVAAKKARDFARADALRAEIRAKGWVVEDTPSGPKLKRA